MTRDPGAGRLARSGEARRAGAWVGGVASAVAYGLSPTITAVAYAHGVSLLVQATLSGGVSGVLILGFAAATGRLRELPLPAVLGLTLLCGPIFGLQMLAYQAAITATGAQVAVVLVHIYPVFVLLLVWLLYRQRIGIPVAILGGAMMAGIALVAGSGSSAFSAAGAAMAVLSAAGYALYLALGERWVRQVGAVAASGLVTVGTTVSIMTLALATDQDFALTADGWRSVVLQGLVVIPIGISGAFYAVRRLGSVRMSLIGLLEPIVGVVVAACVLSEQLEPIQWVGVTVILAACGLLPWATRPKPSRPRDRCSAAARSSARSSL
ncbi:DMT family transporter [Nocardia sp. NEAU-G5]|uniref:DMT family transporter n=1 Tax=Nocardia albiluteola TaxID=2842303 RepID=A0ABS6BB78_9NOCA|nr:DMT family transporter [Nocardia albiluteola]MBU3066670.1 DMT family transporter [Nocardia albiluteola]